MTRSAEQVLEEYLVAAAKAGDRGAMGQLARLRGPRLLAHATRLLGDAEAARDVVQAAWVEILRGLAGLRDGAAFRAWSTRIVTRGCAKAIGGQQRDRALAASYAAEAEVEVAEDGPGAADAARVRAAIRRLPPAQAAAVALVYLDDMTLAEAALAMDVPLGTMKTRLMHARAKLKEMLDGQA